MLRGREVLDFTACEFTKKSREVKMESLPCRKNIFFPSAYRNTTAEH